jgi:hypothetical protein
MIINATLISSLNACSDRYDNYVLHYGTTDYDVDTFLDLDNITYQDKIWVLRRIMNATQARIFAILCADSVLPIFESKYPNDYRVRNCLNFLKSIKDLGNLTEEEKTELKFQRKAAAATYSADAATYSAAAAYADAATYSAAAAATYSAADAATYSAAAAATYSAAAAATYSAAAAYAAYADAKIQQQNLNLEYLKQAMSI